MGAVCWHRISTRRERAANHKPREYHETQSFSRPPVTDIVTSDTTKDSTRTVLLWPFSTAHLASDLSLRSPHPVPERPPPRGAPTVHELGAVAVDVDQAVGGGVVVAPDALQTETLPGGLGH